MWPTIDGTRILIDAEARLVGDTVSVMVDRLADLDPDEVQPHPIGIDWFDQWDCYQQLWLLEQVVESLFTIAPPLSPAAIWEATVDAIFWRLIELIEMEIDESPLDHHWRTSTIAAFECQRGRLPKITVDETEISRWRIVVAQIADMILGVTSYQQAEAFRDGDLQRSRKFLRQKALPDDFLQRIAPLRTAAQTQQSIAQIRSIIGDDGK